MIIRRAALALAVAATFAVAAPVATAAPSGEEFELECDELGELTVVINPGQGIWTPAFVVGSTQRLVPYAFDATVDDIEIDGEPIEIVDAKNPPRNGRTVGCTFEQGFPIGPFTISGTVSVSYTPTR